MSGEAVVVVGAGPAGVRAAEVMSAPGAQVTLVDENAAAGGRVYRQPPGGGPLDHKAHYGFAAGKAQRLHATAAAIAERIRYLPRTRAWKIEDKRLFVSRDGEQEVLPFEALILAPGANDLVLPFPGSTGPSVYTLADADTALRDTGAPLGRRTVLLGTGPHLYQVAYRHLVAGAEIGAVLETADQGLARGQLAGLLSGGLNLAKELYILHRLRAAKVPMLAGVRPLAVVGETAMEGLRCRDGEGTEFQVTGDALAVGFGLSPDTRLADLAGCAVAYDPAQRQWLPTVDEDGLTSVPGIYVVGDGRRVAGADTAEAAGTLAAFAVLIELGYPVTNGTHIFWGTRAGYGRTYRQALLAAFPPPVDLAAAAPDDCVVCRCQGVTAGALRQAGGMDEAVATCGLATGPCRGRDCAVAAAEVLAAARGVEPEAVGRPRLPAPTEP